jgi:hypothetical protein
MCNITQITQFLTSKRVVQLLLAHRSKQPERLGQGDGRATSDAADLLAIQEARKGAGRYKKAPTPDALQSITAALLVLLGEAPVN